MLLMPYPDSARMDPFYDEPTLAISCDVLEPSTGKGYERDPRTIAKKAEAYLTDALAANNAKKVPAIPVPSGIGKPDQRMLTHV